MSAMEGGVQNFGKSADIILERSLIFTDKGKKLQDDNRTLRVLFSKKSLFRNIKQV